MYFFKLLAASASWWESRDLKDTKFLQVL